MFKCIGLVVTLVFLQVSSVFAEDTSCRWAAKITSMKGLVEIQKNTTLDWITADLNETLCAGDSLRTDKHSRATVQIQDETFMELKERTTIRFSANQENEQGIFTELINLFKGEAYLRSRRPRGFIMETPFVNVMHEGTEFLVKVDEESTQVVVFDGVVVASNTLGEVRLTEGQSALTLKGQAPAIGPRIELRDAVQWTLYYPPVIDYTTAGRKLSYSRLKPALDRFQDNDLTGAFEQLDKVNEAERNADYHIFYASLSLMVGQVEQAQQHLNRVTQDSKKNAKVLSLQSIIALAKNDQQQALKLAEQAQQVNPQAAAPNIALSYAYQSLFDIDKALKSATQAAQTDPDNGLAWARVSEMELATGNVDASMEAASKAQTLNPRLAKTNTVLGFARLASLDLSEAEQSFRTAIQRDPSDPLARLGLGLAKIRQGHIKSGTKEMETAANLDPDNALIRSYLGKAYYEQRRGDIASTEYAIAKKLDPNDPTPWFYDAIYKQTVNRPVEALHDMQKAIELNDNRAVFRSKLLLDQDLAGRAVSLARIYQNLGFDQLAINESSKSLSKDATNYSAHRFLSDTYSQRPRSEAARVSEFMQAQLLQPININPVQPQSVESNLNILLGVSPSEVGFNEYTPLFERDGIQFTGTGTFGNNDTYADQAVLSGIFKKLSYSLGQFHYETNGFRENNELRHNLYNVFAQLSVTDDLDLQFEYRRRESKEGDLRLSFDSSFNKILDRKIIQNTSRLGIKYMLGQHSGLIISFQHVDRKETVFDFSIPSTVDPVELPALDVPTRLDTFNNFIDKRHGNDIQSQYFFKTKKITFLSGINFYHFNGDRVQRAELDQRFVEELVDPRRQLRLRTDEDRSGHSIDGYLYSTFNFPDNLFLTLGLSVVSFEDGQKKLVNFDRVLPKVGFQWQVLKPISFRATYFKTVKRSLIFESTLEPTQIAGFHQQFDDFNGTIAERFGIGLDINFSKNISGGLEISRRNVDVPRIFERIDFIGDPAISREAKVFSTFEYERQRENQYRAYFYWKPMRDWALSAEYRLERFRRKPSIQQFEGRAPETAEPLIPEDIWTTTIPVSINYFNGSGFFSSVGATYVYQKVSDAPEVEFANDKENFFVVDASIGYRLPKRRGIISLEVKNLFDNKFNYSDLNIQTPDPSQPLFLPDRTILGRFLLTF